MKQQPLENIIYEDGKQEIRLNFGMGLINIGVAKYGDEGNCIFFEILKEKHEIGENLLDRREEVTDKNAPLFTLFFDNEKSLDVLQGAVNEIKKLNESKNNE